MTPRGLRQAGTALLLLTAAFATAVAVAAVLAVGVGDVGLVPSFIAMPLLSLLCWQKGIPGAAWGLMAVYGVLSWLLGLSWGGWLVYGLLPYTAGNIAHRWARRADGVDADAA